MNLFLKIFLTPLIIVFGIIFGAIWTPISLVEQIWTEKEEQ